jgi:1-acyl-sn-glycerol-3-phosphate acyltransferase
MLKIVSRLILLIKGWTYNVDALKTVDKCVLIVAPHTSAWDMAIGKAVFVLAKIPAKIAIKKEAFFWPLNWFLRYLGGFPIDRTPKDGTKQRLSLVDFDVKEAIVEKIFYTTGDMDKDMSDIMDYYKDKTHLGKYPNRCVTDERWS